MDLKETENKLKEKASQVEVEDYSDRMDRIRGRLVDRQKTKKNQSKKWIPVAISVCLVICCAVLLPFVLRPEQVYFNGSALYIDAVDEEDVFYQKLDEANIHPVDFGDYTLDIHDLLVTDKNVVKGGIVEFFDETEMIFVTIKFYDSTVIVQDDEYKGGTEYQTGGAKITYKEIGNVDDAFDYIALAKHSGLTYTIQYTSLEDTFLTFLDELFQ